MADRSPNYPAFNLEDSILLIEKLYSKCGRSPVTREIASTAFGYASLNGSAQKAIASVVGYGLADKSKGKMCISAEALKIIRSLDEASKREALRECATKPRAFANIATEYPHSDEEILSRQLTHDGFSDEGSKRAARIYKENEAFVGCEVQSDDHDVAQSEANSTNDSSTTSVDIQPKKTLSSGNMISPAVVTTPQVNLSAFVPIPLDIGDALIPKGMSEDDFGFLMDALNLYKRKIVSKQTPPAQEGSE